MFYSQSPRARMGAATPEAGHARGRVGKSPDWLSWEGSVWFASFRGVGVHGCLGDEGRENAGRRRWPRAQALDGCACRQTPSLGGAMSLGSAQPPDVNPACSVVRKSRIHTACRRFASRVLSHLPALLRLTCRLRSALVPEPAADREPPRPTQPRASQCCAPGKGTRLSDPGSSTMKGLMLREPHLNAVSPPSCLSAAKILQN